LGLSGCSKSSQEKETGNIGFEIAYEHAYKPEEHVILALEVAGKQDEAGSSIDDAHTASNNVPYGRSCFRALEDKR
jgi:hypothetical protein